MISAISKNNILIRISDERIKHIFENHPETKGCIHWFIETIEKPDYIFSGDFGELIAVKKYQKTPVSENKYLTLAYKETNKLDGFILTAYFSRGINKKRKLIWKL
jgi:hypothetical protein